MACPPNSDIFLVDKVCIHVKSYYKNRKDLTSRGDVRGDKILHNHHTIVNVKSRLWVNDEDVTRTVNPVCFISAILNNKLDKMGVLMSEDGVEDRSRESEVIQLINNRVFTTMERCTTALSNRALAAEFMRKKIVEYLEEPPENPFRLSELDKRFQQDGDFEQISLLEARNQLGLAEGSDM